MTRPLCLLAAVLMHARPVAAVQREGARRPPALGRPAMLAREVHRIQIERRALQYLAHRQAAEGYVIAASFDEPPTARAEFIDNAVTRAVAAVEPEEAGRVMDGAAGARPAATVDALLERWWAQREAPVAIPLEPYRALVAALAARLGALTASAQGEAEFLASARAQILDPIDEHGFTDGAGRSVGAAQARPVIARLRLIIALVANESRDYPAFARTLSVEMARLGRWAGIARSSEDLSGAIEKIIDELSGLHKPPREDPVMPLFDRDSTDEPHGGSPR